MIKSGLKDKPLRPISTHIVQAELGVDESVGESRSRVLDGAHRAVDHVHQSGLSVLEVHVGGVVGNGLLGLEKK